MTGTTLFSGIGAPEVAMPWIDWKFTAEIEPFPCAVIAERHKLPNLGSVTTPDFIDRAQQFGQIDLLVFGSPCQDLSVAGKRAGMAGERSGLFFDAMRIIRGLRCRFALWENVPGAFSSNDGLDFAAVVGEMAGIRIDVPCDGWRNTGVAVGPDGLVEWCVLDAQWFGVPQRRRRIFALRDSGDWQSRGPILFERESLQGNTPPRREAGPGVAALTSNGVGTCGADDNQAQAGHLVAGFNNTGQGWWNDAEVAAGLRDMSAGGGSREATLITSTGETSHCLNAGGMGRIDYESETLVAVPILEAGARTGKSTTDLRAGSGIGEDGDPMFTLQSGKQHAVATLPVIGTFTCGRGGIGVGAIQQSSAVRRLTPRECERLQGFPDNFTAVQFRGKKAADGPRYKALGNSMAVPVLAWIGRRIIEAAR